MFSIDLTLKYSPIPITVQRKESEDAQKVYQDVLNALKADTPQLVELTCEKDPEKKVAVFSDQVSAVILSQKDGSPAGRPAGFFMQQS
ncbi:hypothetical protein PCC7418_2068 [Halothece sp. PCC 7418]|uniref:hypothetical protein n=1 Tax=Halothece sp. (strain PCC 7418) TaxID=65093 RepID=UPI0002A08A3E|nr:hypothetical protein [Halothece sp. PCC 7418]AFZ44231.1 hypothetical protein PCC7418_2068 [Halothece sp. PCC 7418]